MKTAKRKQTFWLEQGEFLGGAERFSLDFFAQLTPTEKRLLQPAVVGAKHPEYQAMLPDDFPVISFVFPQVAGGPFRKLWAVWALFWQASKLKKLIDPQTQPQWVTNTPRGHFLLLLAKICWRLPGRWVCIFHDFTTRPPWLLRQICLKSDILIANSLPTRRYLREALPESKHRKIRIIENGVNFEQVPDSAPPTEIQKIIHLGRIDPRKGQRYTVEAADLLLERNPDLQFSLVGASVAQDPNTTLYQQEITKFIKKRNLGNVTLLGEVRDPFAEIAKHDLLLVLPTEPETFGRIVIEGLACHKLVIAFEQVGPQEILKQYHQWLIAQGFIQPGTPNPLLIEPDNSMTLAEAIAYFADNPNAATPYTTHGRAFVEKHYHVKETKKRLIDVLTS